MNLLLLVVMILLLSWAGREEGFRIGFRSPSSDNHDGFGMQVLKGADKTPGFSWGGILIFVVIILLSLLTVLFLVFIRLGGMATDPGPSPERGILDQFPWLLICIAAPALVAASLGVVSFVGGLVTLLLGSTSPQRKLILVLIVLLTAVLSLSVLSSLFDWQWNFPDIIGLVSGVLGTSLTLFDRYLARAKL